MPTPTPPAFAEIAGNFACLEDWEDKYRYLIDLGRSLTPLAPGEQSAANKVQGCVSQVWLAFNHEDERIIFRGESDAHIVRGLIAVLASLYCGQKPDTILAHDAEKAFAELGLDSHLSPQRSNGFYAMVARIRREAEARQLAETG